MIFVFILIIQKKRDIALSDRVKYFYQKTNLCDKGCKQKSFDLKTQRAECDCQYNDIETEEKNNELIKDNQILELVGGDFLEIINTSNLFIVKCYKYIFKHINKSFGAIISLILLVLNIIFTILFYVAELNRIQIYIYKLTEDYINYLFRQTRNEPPKKKKKKKNNNKDDVISSVKSDFSNIVVQNDKLKDLKNKVIELNIIC